MNESNDNPYKTPDATLVQTASDDSIQSFNRFSAWWVFGLTILTLGIYPYYWMYSRAKIINSMHQDKISPVLMFLFLIVVALSYASGFFGDSQAAVLVGLVITLVYLVLYLMVLFKIRNRLQDIMNRSSNHEHKLGPVLTFFFYAIYLQYKINECLDGLESNP